MRTSVKLGAYAVALVMVTRDGYRLVPVTARLGPTFRFRILGPDGATMATAGVAAPTHRVDDGDTHN